jgi:arylsulfatase A-like enzyme
LLTASCGGPGKRAASVLVVTIDTLRPDHLGAYGHPGARTPHLDALARRGLQFTRARTPYPLTLPSHASIFTGLYPRSHGARRNDSFNLTREAPTLATILKSLGYETGAVVATFVLNSNFGLARGFDRYDDHWGMRGAGSGTLERRAQEVTDRALAWHFGIGERPFLLWAHFFDPHDDYEPPAPWDAAFPKSPYDGEIAHTDREFGRLLGTLDERGALRDAVIALTSDHGEAFGEHGEFGHGYFVYETTLRVPMILTGSGTARLGHEIRSDDARTVDLLPTLGDLLGLPLPEELPGRSLLTTRDSRPLLFETLEPEIAYGATRLAGLLDDNWKYIQAPVPELYNLDSDPDELRNLHRDTAPRAEEMRARLAETLARTAPATRGEAVDDETRDKLMALGYIGGDEGTSVTSRRDPKEIVDLIPVMHRGIELCRTGRMEEGVALLEEILLQDPGNGKALYWVSKSHADRGDFQAALTTYRAAIEMDPNVADYYNQAGLIFARAGETRNAVRSFRRALQLDPGLVAAHLNLATGLAQMGRPAKAREALDRALSIDPESDAAKQIARMLEETGRH